MKKKVSLIGIGMGMPEGMTLEAKKRMEAAQLFIGAGRMLLVLPEEKKRRIEEYRVPQIVECLAKEKDWEAACILLSGDSGFFSGAKKLAGALKDYEVEVLPGISTLSYFCAKLQIPWDEVCFASLHGMQMNLIARVQRNRYTFCLLGGSKDLYTLCDKLEFYGFGQVKLFVGERLGYPEERIICGNVDEIRKKEYGALLCILLQNECPKKVSGFLPDSVWIRGKVPMTKAEIRYVSLGKLELASDSILYDIGAGTGSVGISAALMYPDASVYAIERKEEAVALLHANRKKLCADNVMVCPGDAEAVIGTLPAPTHVFIGGSGGRLTKLIEKLLAKNPKLRMVINIVTLESLAELTRLLESLTEVTVELVQLQSLPVKTVGHYHMTEPSHPVTIVTIQGGKSGEAEA